MQKNRKLRIAQVAPLWFPIPPQKYGGIERVVALLCDGLVDKGHDVTLFAAPGSETKAKLESVYPAPLKEAGIPWENPLWNLRNISHAFNRANAGEFDVVHAHMDLWALFFEDFSKVPVIHTMHNLLQEEDDDHRIRLYGQKIHEINPAFISQSALKQSVLPVSKPRVIYNGVDLEHFKYDPKGGDHYIWISRIDDYKGIETAIRAAQHLNLTLTLAGRLDPACEDFFNKKVQPHLNEKIRFIGELSQDELPEFYGSAKATLFPIEWEEPFGLVVAESMACGTPVVAYERGAMPEIIKDGVSGFVVKSGDFDGFLEAIKKVDTLSRKATREHMEQNFSKELMVDRYEKAYYELLEE